MADVRLGQVAVAAKPIPRFGNETYWAGAWLAAWQRCGNSVGSDGELLGFIYGQGPDCDHVMTEILQILMNTTPGGGAMIASYINRYGSGPIELYPFNPEPKLTQEAAI